MTDFTTYLGWLVFGCAALILLGIVADIAFGGVLRRQRFTDKPESRDSDTRRHE